jgi:chitinase
MMTRFTLFRSSCPLPGLLALALAACTGHPEYASEESAVEVTGSGIIVDLLPTNTWQGGFNGAVRIRDTAFASPITSFEIGFKLGGGAGVIGTPWNGNITAADASGNRTATNPDWLQLHPIQIGQTWDVGFTGTGTFTDSDCDIVIVIINGHVIILPPPPPPPDPPCEICDNIPPVIGTLVSSENTVTAAGSITLFATASDNVGVTRVDFFDGTTRLGTDTAAPFTQTVALNAASNGTHSYTAKAFDAAGNNTTSTAVTVNVSITNATWRPPAPLPPLVTGYQSHDKD